MILKWIRKENEEYKCESSLLGVKDSIEEEVVMQHELGVIDEIEENQFFK